MAGEQTAVSKLYGQIALSGLLCQGQAYDALILLFLSCSQCRCR